FALEPRRVVPVVEGPDDETAMARPKLCERRLRIGVFVSCASYVPRLARLLRAARTLPSDSYVVRVHALGCSPPGDLGQDVHVVAGFTTRDLADLFAEIDVVVVQPQSFHEVDRVAQVAR